MHKRIQYSNGAVLLNDFESTNAGDTNVNDTLRANAVEPVTVQFFEDDQVTPKLLPDGSVLGWNANSQANVTNDPPLFAALPFSYDAGTGFYRASFYARNAYASALVAAADPAYLSAQFSWLEPGASEPRKTNRYPAYLSASVNQDGDDGTAVYPPAADLLTTASIGTTPGTVARGDDPRFDTQIDFLRSMVDRLKPASEFIFTGGAFAGQIGFRPGGTAYYAAEYLRDTAMAMRDYPDAYTADEILGHITRFATSQDATTHAVYDALLIDSTVQVPGGNPGAFTTNPAYDNIYELIDCCYTHYLKTGLPTAYTTYQTRLQNALTFVNIQNHLVYVPAGTDQTGVGFEDSIKATGYLMGCSVYRYRAYGQLAAMATAAGQTANATTYSAEQALIPAALHTYLWDATRGLYRTASIDNSAHSVAWSAYAVYSGAAYPADVAPVCNALLQMRPGYSLGDAGHTCYQGGQVSHMPADESFTVFRGGYGGSAGRYQDGAFWGSFTGWTAYCLALLNQGEADKLIGELIARYSLQGNVAPLEAENTTLSYQGGPLYIISASLPLAYWNGRSAAPPPGQLSTWERLTSGNPGLLNSGVFTFGINVPAATPGVYAGTSGGTGRLVLSNGTAAQDWGVDNSAGNCRWFQNGAVQMTLSGTAYLTLGTTGVPGRFILSSGTNGQDWGYDNQTGTARWFQNGTVYMTLSAAGLLSATAFAGDVSRCTGFPASGSSTFPFTGLAYAASIALDFSAGPNFTLALTGDVTLSSANLASGRELALVITADSSARNFTFPAGWKFIEVAAPASIAAGKTAVLSLTSTGTTDAGVIAAYAVQP